MKQNMVRYHERPNNKIMRNSIILLLLFFCGVGIAHGQSKGADIVPAVRSFLEDWLLKRDIDGALLFLSDKPLFPSCIANKGNGRNKWGQSKASISKELRVQLRAIFRQKKFHSLSEILERPASVVYLEDNPKLPAFERMDAGDLAPIVDIYPVNDEIRKRLLTYTCVRNADTERYAKGISENKELYLVLTDSKLSDAGLTFLWTRENAKLRILTIDVRLP